MRDCHCLRNSAKKIFYLLDNYHVPMTRTEYFEAIAETSNIDKIDMQEHYC